MRQGSVTPGDMRRRVSFQQREQVKGGDGAGNYEGPFLHVFDRAAKIVFLVGGEEVTANRLQQIQPAVITVRSDTSTRQVDNSWRIEDARPPDGAVPVVYRIESVINRDGLNIWLDFLCTSGKPSP